MTKISVVTINFNDAKGLEKTIESVLAQTNTDYELIVVDGNSTDGSKEIILKFKEKLAHWVSEKDNGIYDAQNKGWKFAKGEYILFLNSGDYLAGNNVFQDFCSVNSTADIIYGNMKTVEKNGIIKERFMPDKIGVKQLYRDTLWHPVSFIRKTVLERFGDYDRSYKIVADYEFFCRVILKYKVSLLHIPVFISVFDTSGISSDPAKRAQLSDERKRVQNRYMNPVLLFFFRMYSRLRR